MRTLSALLALGLVVPCLAQTSSTPQPPAAKKVHTEKAINGAVLVDDYGWLRERQSPEVQRYLEAENSYAEAVTADQKPLADKLYAETLGHIKQTDDSVPYRKHGYWYYTRTEEGKQYGIYCRRKRSMSAPEEVYLDVNALAKGEKFMSVGSVEVSDDTHLLAYSTDNVGFRQYRLHVKDLRTGAVLPDSCGAGDEPDVGGGQQDAAVWHGGCADQAIEPGPPACPGWCGGQRSGGV